MADPAQMRNTEIELELFKNLCYNENELIKPVCDHKTKIKNLFDRRFL